MAIIGPTYQNHDYRKTLPSGSHFGYDLEERTLYKQQPLVDHALPIPYRRLNLDARLLQYLPGKTTGYPGVASTINAVSRIMIGNGTGYQQKAFNKAYADLIDSMHDTVSLGLALAEAREAADMIEHRAAHLRTGWHALLQGNFLQFLKHFNLRPKAHHKGWNWSRPHQAAALWLEYWFGWAPFVADIYGALSLLEQPYPEKFIKGRGSVKYFKDSSVKASGASGYVRKHRTSVLVRCQLGCRVRVENPLLYRLNEYGVLNPALVVWGRKPLSFLVDWFLPVSQFLGAFTDFAGVTRDYEYTTYSQKAVEEDFIYGTGANSAGALGQVKISGSLTERYTGIGTPFFTPKLIRGLSVTRAATAIALLVTSFTKRA